MLCVMLYTTILCSHGKHMSMFPLVYLFEKRTFLNSANFDFPIGNDGFSLWYKAHVSLIEK